MITLLTLLLDFIRVYLQLLRPGGMRAIAAENAALRKQLLVVSRKQKRTHKLTTLERIIFGMLAAMVKPKRLSRIAIVIKPATLLNFIKP